MLSLILYSFLIKFLLLLRRKLIRVCCQLPSCSVVPLPLSLPEKRLVHLPPSSFSPHLFPASDSVRNFPVTSGSVTAERFGHRCRFCLRLCRRPSFRFLASSLPCFWRQIPSLCQTLSLFHLLQIFDAIFACCWLCSSLACCWLCSFGSFDFPLLVGMLFSRSSYPCCFLPLTTDSRAVVLSLFAVFWRRLLQHYFVVAYCSEVRLMHLQRHYSACATS